MSWRNQQYMEIRLLNNGPEFEVVRPPAPTYEQAIVSMYLDARRIVGRGRELKQEMLDARLLLRANSQAIARNRKGVGRYPPGTRWHEEWAAPLRRYIARHGSYLDKLRDAQEKYYAWVAQYGEL